MPENVRQTLGSIFSGSKDHQGRQPMEKAQDGVHGESTKAHSKRAIKQQRLEKFEEQVQTLQTDNEDLKLGLQRTMHKNRFFRRALEQAHEEIKRSYKEIAGLKRDILLAEEGSRRVTEILAESQQKLDNAYQANDKLVIKMTQLEKWTDQLAEEEIKDLVAQLYHDLEMWAKRHFYGSAQRSTGQLSEDSFSNGLQILYQAYSYISWIIYQRILCPFMVGIRSEELENCLSLIDKGVRKSCPTHVVQHWRSATCSAISSLSGEYLEMFYESVVEDMDSEYARLSSTDIHKRREQLNKILGRFVELKQKLDRQVDIYNFEWVDSDSPVNDEEMASFTGVCQYGAFVQYTLAPALYKILPDGERKLVAKAIVTPYTIAQDSEVMDSLEALI